MCYGDNVTLNMFTWINAAGGVEIGNNVLIGPRVIIHSANHRFADRETPIRYQGHEYRRVVIEDDVWIGGGAIILPGVRIGKGAVVGAGAVVTKDVPPFSVVAGVPARVIKER
ncbi:MAG: acyltransferase [Thermoplasmata archaeon]|nr:acyltransferase [Thermoplasmata archaeon]